MPCSCILRGGQEILNHAAFAREPYRVASVASGATAARSFGSFHMLPGSIILSRDEAGCLQQTSCICQRVLGPRIAHMYNTLGAVPRHMWPPQCRILWHKQRKLLHMAQPKAGYCTAEENTAEYCRSPEVCRSMCITIPTTWCTSGQQLYALEIHHTTFDSLQVLNHPLFKEAASFLSISNVGVYALSHCCIEHACGHLHGFLAEPTEKRCVVWVLQAEQCEMPWRESH